MNADLFQNERCDKPYDFQYDLRESITNVVGTVLVGTTFKDKNLASGIPDLGRVLAPFSGADPRSIAPELRYTRRRTPAIYNFLMLNVRFQPVVVITALNLKPHLSGRIS